MKVIRGFWIVAVMAIGSLLTASSALAGEWEWDLSENAVSVGIADAEWTISKDFPGTKLLFDLHYAIIQNPGKSDDEYRIRENLAAIVDIDLQWGIGETGLEIGKLTFTPYAMQWDIKYDNPGKLRATLDQVEFGAIQVSFDDPLGIDSYTEVSFVRVGRTWNYFPFNDSPFSMILGVKVSTGWAWAESVDPTYANVSNAFSGLGMTLGFRHEKLGMIYTDDRTVVGFTMGSPATGGATSREARVRFGYYKQFYRCLSLDIFLEKRSFNFADPQVPDLYTKSKRTGVEFGCIFK